MQEHSTTSGTGNYARYRQAAFNQPGHYPLERVPDPERYRHLVILPTITERTQVLGTWIELHHAPPEHTALVGRRIRLRWAQTPDHNARFWGATRYVSFHDEAHKAVAEGVVLAERVDGLANVNPFESLAAAYPLDDMEVRLDGVIEVELTPADGGAPILFTAFEPVQVTGRYYALVRFLGPAGEGDDCYRVRHYQQTTGTFDGP
jgi:predicted Abi (CAAX) family protease